MNMYVNHICLLFSLVLLFGCTNREDHNENLISINLLRDSIDFDLNFDLINHIFLESTDEALYLEARKMWIIDSSIYLLDNDIDHRKLLHFKTTGEFMNKTHRGKGPGEFLYLSDFFYNEVDRQILALALMRKKLVVFDRNLNLIKEQNITSGEVIDNFARMENGHWIVNKPFTQGTPIGNFYYFGVAKSLEFKDIQHLYLELPYSLKYYFLRDPISRHYDETMKLSSPMDMRIYEIIGDSLSVAYNFDFGELTLPRDIIWGKSNDEFFSILNNSDYVSGINKIIETEKYLAFEFVWHREIEFLIMNRITLNYITSIELQKTGLLPEGELMTIDCEANYVIKSAPDIFNKWQEMYKLPDNMHIAKNYGNDVLTIFKLVI